MKITNKLPQFENKTAFLVLTGSREAVFYIAGDGNIDQIESFKADKPKYSDTEGHFETRSGGKTVRAGSPFEPTDVTDASVREFLNNLEEELKNVSNHYNSIDVLYIFCPNHIKNEIQKRIPDTLNNKKRVVIKGNHYDAHPFELLKKIQKKENRNPIKPISEAALKILNKFKR